MAVSRPVADDVPEAEARIPSDWLMASLDLDMVRRAQRPDTRATLTNEALSMVGIELRIERRWIRERFWKHIRDSVARGYVHHSTPVELVLRGDRRTLDRPR